MYKVRQSSAVSCDHLYAQTARRSILHGGTRHARGRNSHRCRQTSRTRARRDQCQTPRSAAHHTHDSATCSGLRVSAAGWEAWEGAAAGGSATGRAGVHSPAAATLCRALPRLGSSAAARCVRGALQPPPCLLMRREERLHQSRGATWSMVRYAVPTSGRRGLAAFPSSVAS